MFGRNNDDNTVWLMPWSTSNFNLQPWRDLRKLCFKTLLKFSAILLFQFVKVDVLGRHQCHVQCYEINFKQLQAILLTGWWHSQASFELFCAIPRVGWSTCEKGVRTQFDNVHKVVGIWIPTCPLSIKATLYGDFQKCAYLSSPLLTTDIRKSLRANQYKQIWFGISVFQCT